MRKYFTIFFGVLIALIAVSQSPTKAYETNGFVRVLHASPDAPAVDVYVNDSKVLSNVPFGTNSDYLPLPKGQYNIKVTPAGVSTPVVIDTSVHVSRGRYYTIAATGRLSEIEATALRDRNRLPVRDDSSRVRFVHFSPDAPAVDITTTDGKAIFRHVRFGDRNMYKRVPAGTYDLQVRLAGTNTVVLNLPGVKFEDGKTYSVFALGLAGGQPTLSAKVVVDNQ